MAAPDANQIYVITVGPDAPDRTYLVETRTGGINLDDLSDEDLAQLKSDLQELIDTCSIEVSDKNDEVEDAQEDLDEKKDIYDEAADTSPPIVEGETTVDTGGDGPDVVEYIAVEISVSLVAYTGNGDDGLGIIQDWSVPVETTFKPNILVFVSGEKVAGSAPLLETDFIGSIPAFGDSLLVNDQGVIIPDLFDPDSERNPDQTFFVGVAAPEAGTLWRVVVGPEVPNQIFDVRSSARPADQVFEVTAIKTFDVQAANLPFVVEVGPELPFKIFDVRTMATPADKTFVVTRGPGNPFQTFEVLAGTTFDVTTSWGIPKKIYTVTLGPAPAPAPDVIYGVSVGGNDAPPIPTPDFTYEVRTSFAIPDRIFSITTVDSFYVDVANPFVVEVGPELPDQIFTVTSSALPYDGLFTFEVGPEIPDQIFETLTISEFEVDAYDPPKNYTIQEAQPTPGAYTYVVTGEGLSFAVQPTLIGTVGQQFRLNVNAPANTLWIKKDQGAGAGETDPYWATISGQGRPQGQLLFRPWEAGRYYYQSEFKENTFGIIDITGTSAPAPNQIFEVNVGASSNYDEIFAVTVGADYPDEIFAITVEGGAPPVNQIYSVETGPQKFDQIFEARVADGPLSYQVINVGAGAYRFSGEGLNGEDNPDLDVKVGQMLEFSLDVAGHPVYIRDVASTGTDENLFTWTDVLIGQGQQLGVMRAIFNTPGTYWYNCAFHGSMRGRINVTGTSAAPTGYAVVASGGEYVVTGGGLVNETDVQIFAAVGETLDFNLAANGHPFWISDREQLGIPTGDTSWANELINNGAEAGLVRVRFNKPGTYWFNCQYHSGMSGRIEVQ